MKTLLLGGARSGKSRIAEIRAASLKKPVIFIATATAGDEEMNARIQHHQKLRSPDWTLIEEPLNLSQILIEYADADVCLLIDCLTLWVSNLLHSSETLLEKETKDFIHHLENSHADVILVSNEVGNGIVPLGELNRKFVDESGRLHQQLAQVCEQVSLVVAGLEQKLKG